MTVAELMRILRTIPQGAREDMEVVVMGQRGRSTEELALVTYPDRLVIATDLGGEQES